MSIFTYNWQTRYILYYFHTFNIFQILNICLFDWSPLILLVGAHIAHFGDFMYKHMFGIDLFIAYKQRLKFLHNTQY